MLSGFFMFKRNLQLTALDYFEFTSDCIEPFLVVLVNIKRLFKLIWRAFFSSSQVVVYSFGISDVLMSLKQTYLPSLFTNKLM
jgi:hypothetical protein